MLFHILGPDHLEVRIGMMDGQSLKFLLGNSMISSSGSGSGSGSVEPLQSPCYTCTKAEECGGSASQASRKLTLHQQTSSSN